MSNSRRDEPYSEPIAIIGMSCRWPGDCDTPSRFWELMLNGRSGDRKVPDWIFRHDSFYHPDPNRPGSVRLKKGHYLAEDTRLFDPEFFGINAVEAMGLDPQQRKLLEVVYECFETAGVPMEKLSGSKTGCFVGNYTLEFSLQMIREAEYAEPYDTTGTNLCILANRLNYFFNLKGPSFTVDTACSSSMYALHLACNSLLAGDCTGAVVAGVNLILGIDTQLKAQKLGAYSATDFCHTFDAAADGYSRGEGVTAIYIKKLSQALRDGDPIRAVIRSTALNANGRTKGITQPSADAQEIVIRDAYQKAGLNPRDTGYFECHGTGTPLGDPIEVSALGRVFAPHRNDPLLIGSVKTNIGHTEACSGLAGLMKAVLILENDLIPPTIGLQRPNPRIDFKGSNVEVVSTTTRFPQSSCKRISVNSFGYGGANGHAIVESLGSFSSASSRFTHLIQPTTRAHRSPQRPANGVSNTRRRSVDYTNTNGSPNGVSGRATNGHANGYTNGYANGYANGHANGSNKFSNGHSNGHLNVSKAATNGARSLSEQRRTFLLPFSAHDEPTLRKNVAALDGVAFKYHARDLAYTLSARRSAFARRAYVVVREDEEVRDLVRATTFSSAATAERGRNLVFVFTGQGAQWPAMGKALMEESAPFRQTLDKLDTVMKEMKHPPNWTIREAICAPPDQSRLSNPDQAQPICTAIQIALIDLFKSWGIHPSFVVGHSSGEIAAAYCAGYLSAAEAIRIAYYRGYTASRSKALGGMLAVGAGPETLAPIVDKIPNVEIACVNSPESSTLSGDLSEIQELSKVLQESGMFARILQTGGKAYHSHHTRAIGETYEALLRKTLMSSSRERKANGVVNKAREITARMASSVTSSILGGDEVLGPSYWRTNFESQVKFRGAVDSIIQTVRSERTRSERNSPCIDFVEIGPHSALESPLKQILAVWGGDVDSSYASVLKRAHNASSTTLKSIGELWSRGYPVSLEKVNKSPLKTKVLVDLPRYQWNYTTLHWNEPRAVLEHKFRTHPRHDILGSRLPGTGKIDWVWRNILDEKHLPWLQDHKVQGQTVFPATGYLCMAIEAITQVLENRGVAEKITGYTLSQVHIGSALLVHNKGAETLFSLQPEAISATTLSKYRYQFKVVSTQMGSDTWTENCRGCISATTVPEKLVEPSIYKSMETDYSVTKEGAYSGLSETGLRYGPCFQGLSEISLDRDRQWITAQTDLRPTKDAMVAESRYVVHPATLDTGLQCMCMALGVKRAQASPNTRIGILPQFFEEIRIQNAAVNNGHLEQPATVKSWGRKLGYRAGRGGVWIADKTSSLCVDFRGIHCVDFENTADNQPARHPFVRMLWKPCIDVLSSKNAAILVEDCPPPVPNPITSPEAARPSTPDTQILWLLDLVAHKDPRHEILQLGGADHLDALTELMQADGSFQRFKSFTCVVPGAEEDYRGHIKVTSDLHRALDRTYNLIVIHDNAVLSSNDSSIQELTKTLHTTGWLLLPTPEMHRMRVELEEAGFYQHINISHWRLLKRVSSAPPKISEIPKEAVTMVHRNLKTNPSRFASELQNALEAVGHEVYHTTLNSLELQPSGPVIVVTDVQSTPVAVNMTADEMEGIRQIVQSAKKTLWLSSGELRSGRNPCHAMISGMLRSLRVEERSLNIDTLDLQSYNAETCRLIVEHLPRVGNSMDTEYVEEDGVLYVCRAAPDRIENEEFNLKLTGEAPVRPTTVNVPGQEKKVRMGLGKVGNPDSIYFREDPRFEKPLPADSVEVKVQYVGMNAKDIFIAMGTFDTKTPDGVEPYYYSTEYAGVVTRIGEDVMDLRPGDKVVTLQPSFYGTYEISRAMHCLKVEGDLEEMVTMPVVYTTAIYALKYLAHLQSDESVLIHNGAGGVGIAAITLAKSIGAEVFTTAGTEAKREFLHQKFGIPHDHIFPSRDSSFVDRLGQTTEGRGVDVILSAQTGDQLHESWTKCLASFGRMIDIGRKEVLDCGKLDMGVFAKNATFASFDLGEIIFEKPKLVHRLLNDMNRLYKDGTIGPIEPRTIYPADQLSPAMRYLMRGVHIGKVLVSYTSKDLVLPVKPSAKSLTLDSEAAYLIIGGMGGLGRSLISWMSQRGARHIIVMSRSGMQSGNAAAEKWLAGLQHQGVDITIVKGDVSKKEDVARAIEAAKLPLRGVIHSAMVLRDALFATMTQEEFETGIRPKVQGSLNLHEALMGHDLDFFVMTSSITGAVGTLSQTNYCAANAMLDSLARHRHSMGLPATSVALGPIAEVGFVAEHESIAQQMLRHGLHSLNEREYLIAMEIAMTDRKRLDPVFQADPAVETYILAGMEPLQLKQSGRKDFGTGIAATDPRLAVLLNHAEDATGRSASEIDDASDAKLLDRLRVAGPDELVRSITQHVIRKLARLLLKEENEFEIDKSVVAYGLDSMIGSEFRGWLYTELGVNLSFLEILDPSTSVAGLVTRISELLPKS